MSDQLLVATRKGLFFVSRAGNGWTIKKGEFLGDNCSMVCHDPRDSSIYAALDHGHFGCKLHRSTDGGASWDEITAPAYPEKPDDYEGAVHPMTGKETPWNLQLIWELRPGGPDQPGQLWCGTIPGGMFRSQDHGKSWDFCRSLWDDPRRQEWFGGGYDFAGIHSVCVDPRDSNHITIGVSCGGVWQSFDNGETWDCKMTGMRAEYMPPERALDPNIQDPHLLANCVSSPDCFWVQHHNGIFKSIDGGTQWEEIENVKPSVFGFAVAVHPNDSNTAWFAPAIKDEKRIPAEGKVVITRTRDGGKSFDMLTDGLPQQHAYDLVFRHALDVDEAGDRLAFGSTTGTLWVSENGGDSWSEVSTHLPPAYAVRFVKA